MTVDCNDTNPVFPPGHPYLSPDPWTGFSKMLNTGTGPGPGLIFFSKKRGRAGPGLSKFTYIGAGDGFVENYLVLTGAGSPGET